MAEEPKRIDIFEETMAHMTYVEVEEADREGAIVLFPIGVIKEHGPHLPLAVDVYGSYLQSRAARSELEKNDRPLYFLRDHHMFWTPVFTGVTVLGLFANSSRIEIQQMRVISKHSQPAGRCRSIGEIVTSAIQ